jgi:RNA polymerase sigma-70 factor (ECF subfamily)
MTAGSDQDLAALLGGDKAAWDAFVRAQAPVIFAAVRRRLVPAGRDADSEDVVQEVFVKLCRNDFRLLRAFDPAKAKLSTYLTVIASSSAIDHLRRLKAPAEALDTLPEEVLAVAPREPVRLSIPEGLLSPRQALVVELLYRQDLLPGEAAEIIGVDPQTVRSMHHKALTKLRKFFAEKDGEGEG